MNFWAKNKIVIEENTKILKKEKDENCTNQLNQKSSAF